MHECYIEYENLIKGGYNKRHYHPAASYFEQQGAKVTTNVFYDEGCSFEGGTFHILVDVIKIARRQEFEKLKIVIPNKNIKYGGKLAAELMAYERTIIAIEEDNDSYVMTIYIPENVWLEASVGRAQGRTKLHPLHMEEAELQVVREACELVPRSAEQLFSLRKALGIGSGNS